MRFCVRAQTLVLVLWITVGIGSVAFAAGEKPSFTPLVIESDATTQHTFMVELALTPEQRQKGLMYRKSMADDHGMLFDYGHEAPIAMWMKNTFIPLDMVFIDRTGVIRHIHKNAIPHDETPIPSRYPVQAVLELNGDITTRLGIKVGDRVRHPVFVGPSQAVPEP